MMNSILILHDIVIVVLLLSVQWVVAYFKQSGKNNAIKQDNRDISYEGKKGENVAIEEDQIQLTHKERLIRILYLAEKIDMAQNKYFLYFHDSTSRQKFDKLMEDLNDMLTDLYHEHRLASLFLPQDLQPMMENLLTNASGMVMEMSVNANNAATYITTYHEYVAFSKEQQYAENQYWKEAEKCLSSLKALSMQKLTLKKDYQEAIQKYANWLGEYLKQDIRTIDVGSMEEPV